MEKRKFYLGSEWIYFKIYTGIKTSDIILIEVIAPLIEELKTENILKKWFFIRYNDPKSHLRIRLNIKNKINSSYLIERINSFLNEYLESGEISDIIFDSYKRELERYGENTIGYAEDFFFKSSELILFFLDYNDVEKIMVSIFYINCLLSYLGLSIEEKKNWIKNFDKSFKLEFNANKNLNIILKKKYSEFSPTYFDFITSNNFKKIRMLIQNNILDVNVVIEKMLILEKSNSLEIHLSDFFQSIFHMHINRLFISNQRLFEMIIYDYLVRIF